MDLLLCEIARVGFVNIPDVVFLNQGVRVFEFVFVFSPFCSMWIEVRGWDGFLVTSCSVRG